MKKFKQFFQEKIILSAVMCVLLLVVLTTATTAWYAISGTTKAYGIKLQAGEAGGAGIKVATEPGGKDIMTDPARPKTAEGIPIISINLKDFKNIQSGKIAPGAYGEMPFYITALGESAKSYSIKVKLEYEPSGSITESQRSKIENMIRDHISVYTEKYTDAAGVVRFRNPLTYFNDEKDRVTAATGDLRANVEVYAPIYWVWNYELTDIPDWRQNQNLFRFRAYSEPDAVRAYDEEDTMLGNYVDDIWFRVYIEGSLGRAGN